MYNVNTTSIVFGLWIGLLLAGTATIELHFEGQIYSHRTLTIITIMFISGVISSAVCWRIFSKTAQISMYKVLKLCLGNLFLYCLVGILVSYAVIVLPGYFAPGAAPLSHSFTDFLYGIVMGSLGVAFSFKTFGLPLLWPFGVISGVIGTFLFVYINKVLNSHPRH